jgi:type II secretory pathway component GspD/PulD (secretin)
VKTKVMVENGGTVVLGGIYQQTERSNVSQGAAAGRRAGARLPVQDPGPRDAKTELLVFITPKIVPTAWHRRALSPHETPPRHPCRTVRRRSGIFYR